MVSVIPSAAPWRRQDELCLPSWRLSDLHYKLIGWLKDEVAGEFIEKCKQLRQESIQIAR